MTNRLQLSNRLTSETQSKSFAAWWTDAK